MHILRNVYCTLLKRRQGQSVENKIRASLVGDHFIDSCELHMFASEGSMGWKDDDSLLPTTGKQMEKRRN